MAVVQQNATKARNVRAFLPNTTHDWRPAGGGHVMKFRWKQLISVALTVTGLQLMLSEQVPPQRPWVLGSKASYEPKHESAHGIKVVLSDRHKKGAIAALVLLAWAGASVAFAVLYNPSKSAFVSIPDDLTVEDRSCRANQTCLLAVGGARAIINAFLPVVEGFNGSTWGSESLLPEGDEGYGVGVSSTAAVIDQRIYIIGHTGFGDMYSRSMEDPTWREEPGMHLKREGFALVVFQNRIWAIGGRTKCTVESLRENEDSSCTKPGWIDRGDQASVIASTSVESIDPRSESEWKVDCSMGGAEEGGEGEGSKCMEIARSGLTAAAFDGQVFVIGGYEGAAVEVFDGNRWKQLSQDFPRSVNGAAAAAYGGKLWVLGGFSYDEHLSNAVAWDGRIWAQGPRMLRRRAWTGAAVFPRCAPTGGDCVELLFVVGGSDKTVGGIAEVESFDGMVWKPEPALLNGRNRLGVVVVSPQQE